MATNRADTLDPALLRPGRLDRKIEFPLPDRRQKRLVFQASGFRLVHGRRPDALPLAQARRRHCSATLPSHAKLPRHVEMCIFAAKLVQRWSLVAVVQACTSQMNLSEDVDA